MNIILIGMPGCGKSTVGVVLAKRIGYRFVDTDLLIQEQSGSLLQELIDRQGSEAFLRLEEAVLSDWEGDHTVVATGGSAVYSQAGMAHLKQDGFVVYIKLELKAIRQRLSNLATRGIAGAESRTLEELYAERQPLYEKYADITVPSDGLTVEQTIDAVIRAVAPCLEPPTEQSAARRPE